MEMVSIDAVVRVPSLQTTAAFAVKPGGAGRLLLQEDMTRDDAPLATACAVIVAVGVLLAFGYVAKLVVLTVLVSALVAFLLDPLVSLLVRVRVPRSLGAFLSIALLLGALGGGVTLLAGKAVDFVQNLPRYSQQIRRGIDAVRARVQKIESTTDKMLPKGGDDGAQKVTVEQGGQWERLISGLGSFTELLIIGSFVPFLVFFMLSWRDHVANATIHLFPARHRKRAGDTVAAIASTMRVYLVGNALLGLVLGVASAIAFALLHIPDFPIAGLLSGFVNLVPAVGPLMAVLPPIVAGLGRTSLGLVAVAAGVVVALHLLAMNVLLPKFVGGRLRLNALVVTLALFFWGWYWGGIGLLLAIPITAAFKIVCDQVPPLRPLGVMLGEEEDARAFVDSDAAGP